MFPEGLTTTPGGISRDFIEDGDSVRLIFAPSGACSMLGVGGVTVVAGNGIALCGGVDRRGFSDGLSDESRVLSSARSVRIGGGIDGKGGGASAEAPGAIFEDRLLRRLTLHELSPDVDEARDRLPLLSVLNAFLSRWLLERLLSLFLRSPGTLRFEGAGWVAGRAISVSGFELRRSEVVPLTADSASP